MKRISIRSFFFLSPTTLRHETKKKLITAKKYPEAKYWFSFDTMVLFNNVVFSTIPFSHQPGFSLLLSSSSPFQYFSPILVTFLCTQSHTLSLTHTHPCTCTHTHNSFHNLLFGFSTRVHTPTARTNNTHIRSHHPYLSNPHSPSAHTHSLSFFLSLSSFHPRTHLSHFSCEGLKPPESLSCFVKND